MRKVYREKYYTTVDAFKSIFGEKAIFAQNHSGLNILIQIRTRLSEKQLLSKAEAEGVILTPVSPLYAEQDNMPVYPQILFEFGGLALEQIAIVVGALYGAWYK